MEESLPIQLTSLNLTVEFDEIYEDVVFAPPEVEGITAVETVDRSLN